MKLTSEKKIIFSVVMPTLQQEVLLYKTCSQQSLKHTVLPFSTQRRSRRRVPRLGPDLVVVTLPFPMRHQPPSLTSPHQ